MDYHTVTNALNHASLSGFALMLVMLACFLVGALATRLALELDAKALWAFINSHKPKSPSEEKEDE